MHCNSFIYKFQVRGSYFPGIVLEYSTDFDALEKSFSLLLVKNIMWVSLYVSAVKRVFWYWFCYP